MGEEMQVAIARIETKLDAALSDMRDHEKRLRSLEGKGGKRWESLVGQVITLVVAAACGVLLGKII